jgi:hypothetical protein
MFGFKSGITIRPHCLQIKKQVKRKPIRIDTVKKGCGCGK